MSIVNHKHKHVFIHVPKCAGSSMERLSFVGGADHDSMSQLLLESPGSYFRWGFVRNPFDRLVSVYHAIWQHSDNDKSREIAPENFEQFAGELVPNKVEAFKFKHLDPQTTFLCDSRGTILLDFVGRYENLNKDWRYVCRKLSVDFVSLPHTNTTQHRNYKEYYTASMVDATVKFYASDFKAFNYPTKL